MLFQTLDDKSECVGVYSNGDLHFDNIPKGLSKTWSYSNFLQGMPIEYASLYVDGRSIDDICPAHLLEDWAKDYKTSKSFYSFKPISKS